MIANVGPALKNYEETLNTLRYANQAKNIRNKPKINEDPKDAKLKEIQDEIKNLKEYLNRMINGKEGTNINEIFEGEITESMKSQMMKRMLDKKQQLEEGHREEMDKIIKMRQITDEERKNLLEEVQRHREEENKERDKNQRILDKISSIQNEIIQGQKTKEKYLKVQKELQLKREKNERIRREQLELQQAASDATLEKCGLERKYANQVEELQEKEELIKKISVRYMQLKADYDEYNESFLSQIKLLKEENSDLEVQSEINKTIIESYFGLEMFAKLNEWIVYSQFIESFKINENAPIEIKNLFADFMSMKEIQQKEYGHNDVDEVTENNILFGSLNCF
jgi:kinesin family protein 3/17